MAAPEPTLGALVKDELRGPVSELVRRLVPELVREQLNGASPSAEAPAEPRSLPQEATKASDATPDLSPSTRRCNGCARTLPADVFSPNHYRCRECRRVEERERSQRKAARKPADEEPHQAPSPQRGRRGRRRLASDAYWNERRRALIEEARLTTEQRGGREYVVRHLAPQFGAVRE